MQFRSSIFVCLSIAISFISAPALADSLSLNQDAPTEIFVRGASRHLTLFDLPGSATVIENNQMLDRGASNAVDVFDLIPGLNFAGGTARPRFFQIRGVGEFEQYEGAPNPSVGVIIDDIDLSGLGIVSSLFDIDQLEVLRGPQATRFGASALAGAINLHSADPSPAFAGQAEAGIGNDELGTVAAVVSGPVSGTNGKLRLRFSTSYLSENGFRNNVYLSEDDTNRRQERTSRLKVVLEPSTDIKFTATYLNVENNSGYDAFSIYNGFTTYSDRPGQDDVRLNAGSLKGEAKLSTEVALESVTSLLHSDQTYSYDGDWGNNSFWSPFDPYDYFSRTNRGRHSFSQELRIKNEPENYIHGESLRWVTGAYYQDLHERSRIRDYFEQTPYRDLDSDYEARTGAGFLELEVPVVRGTSLTGGLRAERRLMDYSDSNPADLTAGHTMYGGSISLAHDIEENIRGYITAARGYKGGGFNPGTRVSEESRLYGPEYLWNFEAGLKGSSWQGRVQGELATFYARRSDAQLKFAFQNDPNDPLAFTYVTKSAAEAYTAGVEGTIRVKVSDRLQLYTNGSLNPTKYASVPEENASLDGREQSHAPTWSYTLGGRYSLTQGWFLRADLVGKDKFYFDDSNSAQSSAYQLLNAGVGYRGERWSWTLWGRNLLNRRYDVRGFFFGVEPPDYPSKEYVQRGDPRAFGTTVNFYF